MTLRNILLAGTALGAAAFLAVPAQAGSKDCCGDVEALKQQINDLQQKVDDLAINYGNQIKDLQSRKSDVVVSMKDGAPTFSTADGAYTMTISGRFHLDAGAYGGIGSTERGYIGTGAANGEASFRRLILGVKGTFAKDWGYDLFFNFGNNSPGIYEAALHYKGIKNVDVVWGAIQPIMTLDDTNSSNDITFMERPAATNLAVGVGASDGRMAFGVTGHGDNFYAGAYYTMDSVGKTNKDHDTQNLVGRVAVAFHPDDASTIHLGASGTYSFERPGDAITFSDRPEMRIDGGNLKTINASVSNVDNVAVYGPEAAFAYGPFRAQAEYYVYSVSRNTGFSDVDFNAWYVSASWVLTGENYKYDMKKANFKGVKPADPFSLNTGGFGAWEIAGRYSQADFNDNGIVGGEQDIWTLGLNWYPNNNVRFMLNYNNVDVSDYKSLGQDLKFDQIGLRTQFKF